MNFNLIVSIFAFAITEINLVRADDWETSYKPISTNFGNFIKKYKKACLNQNSKLFPDNNPAQEWFDKTDSKNFYTNTQDTISLLTSNFKPSKTEDGVSAVRKAMKTLCERINTNESISDKYKYGGIPLRDYLSKDLYIDGLGETGENFNLDCPLEPPIAPVFGKIRPYFYAFLTAYRQVCLDQNVNVFNKYEPVEAWNKDLNSENFLQQTTTVINNMTEPFKLHKTNAGVNSVKMAIRALCKKINSNKNIDDKYKYGQIPLRDHFKDEIYIKALGATEADFQTDCPPKAEAPQSV